MMDKYICIIVAAEVVNNCRNLADQFNQPGMWVTPLSPTGAEPPTHFISAGPVAPVFWDALQTPEALKALADARGIPLTLDEAQAMFVGSDVSDDDPPQVAMARLGLTLAWPPLPGMAI